MDRWEAAICVMIGGPSLSMEEEVERHVERAVNTARLVLACESISTISISCAGISHTRKGTSAIRDTYRPKQKGKLASGRRYQTMRHH